MPHSLTQPKLVRVNPPIFEATFQGKRVTIHLDSSALLKLEGTERYERVGEVLVLRQDAVASAAQRLLQARQAQSASDEIVLTLTALDLD